MSKKLAEPFQPIPSLITGEESTRYSDLDVQREQLHDFFQAWLGIVQLPDFLSIILEYSRFKHSPLNT
jgi:hypothetical protein